MRVWDTKTGKELRKYEGQGGCVGCVAFFPDGQRIACASYDGTARIWERRRSHEQSVEPAGIQPNV